MSEVLKILLSVIRWIGILLLWVLRIVLGVIVLVILLIILALSIPIRIRAEGHYRKDDIFVDGIITYCFRLVQVHIFFKDNQFAYEVRIFGKVKLDSASKEDAKEEGKKKEKKKKPKKEKEKKDDEDVPRWARELLRPIQAGKLEKILAWKDKIIYYRDRYGLARALKRFFRHIARTIRFGESHLALVYGTGDPCDTGQSFGLIYTLLNVTHRKKLHLDLEPDFLESRMDAEGDLEFSLVLRSLVGAVLGLLINRSVWRLVCTLLKEKKKKKKKKHQKPSGKADCQEYNQEERTVSSSGSQGVHHEIQ